MIFEGILEALVREESIHIQNENYFYVQQCNPVYEQYGFQRHLYEEVPIFTVQFKKKKKMEHSVTESKGQGQDCQRLGRIHRGRGILTVMYRLCLAFRYKSKTALI